MNYLNDIEDEIKGLGFEIIEKDFERPWGGFLVIDERQSQEFTNRFFNGIHIKNLKISGKLSPKILIIKPNSKLSSELADRASSKSTIPLTSKPLFLLWLNHVSAAATGSCKRSGISTSIATSVFCFITRHSISMG